MLFGLMEGSEGTTSLHEQGSNKSGHGHHPSSLGLPVLQSNDVTDQSHQTFGNIAPLVAFALPTRGTSCTFPLHLNFPTSTSVTSFHFSVNDERLFIYKRIDRPLYQSMDTQVLVVEARNLQRLSFSAHIVKLVAIAVSANPYRTDSVKEGQPVIRGIILEYHTGGTLEQWLDDDEKGNKS